MPLGQDVGRARLFGLVAGVSIDPLQPGNNYFFTRLAHPGTTTGEVVYLDAPGGFLGALGLYGIGVTPLAPLPEAWVVTAGQPLAVAWDVPPVGARSRVLVEINVDQHGLTPATLTCDLPDTGEAEIPQGIVDELVAAGVTGYPIGRVTRRTSDSAVRPAGCVDFSVTSVRAVAVEVTGFEPCSGPGDCTPPQTCNLEIEQCQ
jgi:hypothetical protein